MNESIIELEQKQRKNREMQIMFFVLAIKTSYIIVLSEFYLESKLPRIDYNFLMNQMCRRQFSIDIYGYCRVLRRNI